jgi:hypothetical protein
MSLYIIMSKSVWGPATWYLLHSMVLKINDDAPTPVVTELKKLIRSITSNLPCPACSAHATSHLSKLKFDHISTVQGLRHFMYHFHNTVNEMLKKSTSLTYEQHIIMYDNMDLRMVIQNFMNIYNNMNSTNVTMMLYSFYRKKTLNDINTFFVNNQKLYRL